VLLHGELQRESDYAAVPDSLDAGSFDIGCLDIGYFGPWSVEDKCAEKIHLIFTEARGA
jgi:hypothetical protein